MNEIHIKGAREHNLQNIDLVIPRDRLVVLTGLSGSGKSSLAFDTIYAEGQRRYVESLSAYARQFLERMDKPDVDTIDGLSPAISIGQKIASHNPRSTVATVTELYDYFRLLFARVGHPFCYKCGKAIVSQTISQMVDALMAFPPGERIQIAAPVIRDRKGEYKKEIALIRQRGFSRLRIDGEMVDLMQGEATVSDKNKKHTIEVIVDRLVLKEGLERRLADALEMAIKMSDGVVVILRESGVALFSEHRACVDCGISYPEIEPRTFSFNSPHGACPTCDGLGTTLEIDPEKVVYSWKSLRDGAIRPWAWRATAFYQALLSAVADHHGFDTATPFDALSLRHREVLLYGSKTEKMKFTYEQDGQRKTVNKPFEGVIPSLARRYREAREDRAELEWYMSRTRCPDCKGARLRPEALAVRVGGKTIADVAGLSIGEALAFVSGLSLTEQERRIADRALREIQQRLTFLDRVGVDYLTLDRAAGTLSGGESQRIRLATQIGASLVGVLYILDEPSIGLHQRDNERLLATLRRLRDLGNSVLVVEHDEETICSADWVIDMGPGAGIHGGRVISQGTPAHIAADVHSLTGQYLSGAKTIALPARRRQALGQIAIRGASENNLRAVDVDIPIGLFTCVTGVSGSGKSTLVLDVLYRTLARRLNGASQPAGACRSLSYTERLDKLVHIDQSAIGRTPRSNPATYVGVFAPIRDLYAALPLSRTRGYTASRFSFNVKGGRCEACKGDGVIKIEMHFLPDVHVTCEACAGRRYNREALDVCYRDASIADVLDMTVDDALAFFKAIPAIREKVETLQEVGLGYIRLGQSATTLSGGEAQRIKLSKELSRRATGRTLYILDEPTTGLHFADIQRLLDILNRFAEAENTVVVIEHNLDVIRNADWIIDLGPEGGHRGGEVIAMGTPEDVARVAHSHTGRFLRERLSRAVVPHARMTTQASH